MGRRSSKQSHPTPVKSDLARIIASKRLASGLALGRLQNAWARALGPAIAAASAPVAFERGRLRVAAKNSAWANELQLMSEMVRQRLNEVIEGERVTEISVFVTKFKQVPGDGE